MDNKSLMSGQIPQSRRGSRLGGPPSVMGLPPAGPNNATGKSRALGHPGLLQTINKLEQESENRAYELISLRTLVLKVEREREDAMAQVKRLTEVNQELQEEIERQNQEIAQLQKDRVDSRVGEWLMGASGLSHVRAAGHAASKAPESASATQAAPSKACWSRDGAASVMSGHPPTVRQHPSESASSEQVHHVPMTQYEAEVKALKDQIQELQEKLAHATTANAEATAAAASLQRHTTTKRRGSSSFQDVSADGRHGSVATHSQMGSPDKCHASEGVPELTRQASTKSRLVSVETVPDLQDAIAKLAADREEQAALRQVEVQHLKYTHQQELRDKDKQIASLQERLHDSARRIEQLESILASEPIPGGDRLGSESSLAIGLASIRSAAFPFVQDLVPGEGPGVPSSGSARFTAGAQLHQLQELVQVLQAQISDKQAQNTAATRTTADLAAQLAGAQAQLADAQLQAQNATRSAADLAAQLAALNSGKEQQMSEAEQQLQAELAEVQAELAKVAEQLTSSQAELEGSRGRVESLTQELTQVKDGLTLELTQVKDGLTQAKAELAACRTDLISAQSALLVATEHSNTVSQQLSEAQQQLADSQAQMILTQQQLSDKQAQLADVQGQLAASRHAAETAQHQHTQQQALLIQSQQQVTDLQGQVSSLQAQLTDVTCKLPELQQQLADAHKKTHSAEKQVAEQQQEIAALQASLTTTQEQLSHAVNSSKSVVEERASAEATATAAAKDKAQLLHKVSELEEGLAAAAQEVAVLTQQRQALQTQVAVVEARLSDSQKVTGDRDTLVSDLQRQVAELDMESTQLRRQMTEKEHCLSDLTTRESTKDTSLLAVQNQLQEKELQLASATQQLEEAQQQLESVIQEAAAQYEVYCEVAGLGQAAAARCRQLSAELTQTKAALQAAQDMAEAELIRKQPVAPPVPVKSVPAKSVPAGKSAASDEQLQQARTQLQAKTKELAAAAQAHQRLEDKLRDSNAQLQQAVQQVNQLRAAEAVRQSSLAKAQAAAVKTDKLGNMETAELRSKSSKMQQLIRDMGAQMASLQVQLKQQISLAEKLSQEMTALQTDLAASRQETKTAEQSTHKVQAQISQEQEAVQSVKSQLAAAEADTRRWRDAHDQVQREVAAVRRRLWDTERKLAAGLGRRQSHSTAAELDQTDKFDSSAVDGGRQLRSSANSQSGTVVPAPPAVGDITSNVSRAEGLDLYRRLRSIASMYHLQLGTSLSAKQRSPSSAGNATPHQLWSTVHAVVAALEAAGSSAAVVSPRSRSPTTPSAHHVVNMWSAPAASPRASSPTSPALPPHAHLMSKMPSKPGALHTMRPGSAPVRHLVANKGLMTRPRQGSFMVASSDTLMGGGQPKPDVARPSTAVCKSSTKLPGLGGWVS